ncbi:hypothetical protein JTE90_015108 [Oedothorax gibbosus]|uniref:ornithine decarboxylase n=1 Tax=Oedothorax gibbosus TaxID=931172 RepID=A0AAV6VT83_9ARAC|nr:hypothetical protein JTE90_015108 [Oedothorax gibbosus]
MVVVFFTGFPRQGRRMSETRSQAIMEIIKNYIVKQNSDIPFYVADLSDVLFKCRYWKSKLPRVEPFYAVKCNTDPVLISLLVSLGVKFDCASKGEMDAVFAAGADPSDIIYAHPFKSNSFLRYAASVKVDLMTFDTDLELIKIQRVYPQARLVIRIRIPNVPAAFPLGDKFGCEVSDAKKILTFAQSLDLNVVGVSFHVGSLCEQPFAYSKAIGMAKEVFNVAEDLGYHFTLLDIGGGFPGSTGSYDTFDKMCYYINQSLEEHFPEGCGVHVIAEPGCYMSNSAYTLCTKIIGKRIRTDTEAEDSECFKKKIFYYLNDGAFGSFSEDFEKYGFHIKPLLSKSQLAGRPVHRSKLWGGTCCSSDVVVEEALLPEMDVGDHLVFDNMGAYTTVLTTSFNGFPAPLTHYVFPPQSTYKTENEKLQPFEDFCRDLGATKLKSFIKIQEYICHDDSNDDLFRKG